MSNVEYTSEQNNFKPTEAWPLQESYKLQLHDDIQKWGDTVIPYLENTHDQDDDARIALFNHLMDAVPKGDVQIATLLQTLISATHLSAQSWYTDRPFTPSEEYLQQRSQAAFKSLFALYKAGIETRV